MNERDLQKAFEEAWLKHFPHIKDASGFFVKEDDGYASASTQSEFAFFKYGASLSLLEGREQLDRMRECLRGIVMRLEQYSYAMTDTGHDIGMLIQWGDAYEFINGPAAPTKEQEGEEA